LPRQRQAAVIKAGAYAGKALDVDGVKALASVPSREVLLSQIAGLLKSPVQRTAAVLAALAQQGVAPKRLPKLRRLIAAHALHPIH
jgi:large subunit ribosomal protein L10